MSALLSVDNGSAQAREPWPSASASLDSPAQLSGACALLALLVQSQSATQTGSKTDVELGAKKLEELKRQLADAVQHAEDAARDSGFFGFLADLFGSDIAQIAGAVAALAAVVATGGASAPLLAIALSEALQVGAKAGAELGLDPKICLVISLASVAVGFCTGSAGVQAAGALAQGARDVELGAHIVQGGATSAGGALRGVAGYYRSQQLNHQADAAGFHGQQDATNLSIEDALANLSRALRAEQQETGTVSEIVHAEAETNTTLSDRV